MRDAIEMGLGERKVEVKREELLKKLRENREKHIKEYQASVYGYRNMAGERLEKLKRKAQQSLDDNFGLIRQKIERFDPEDEDPLDDIVTLLHSMQFSLKVPREHTRSYDVAIQMAEWEVNETVILTQAQFQCFVLDDWEWQAEFKHLNRTYSR